MTLPQSVREVIADHVVFTIECIDRLYLNVYQPKLQYATGLVGYIRGHLGLPIPSTAVLADKTRRFDQGVHQFAKDHNVDWVDLKKGQRKDDIMKDHLVGVAGCDQGCCLWAGPKRRLGCSVRRNAAVTMVVATRGSCRPPGW